MRERLFKEIRMILPTWIIVILSLGAIGLLTLVNNEGPRWMDSWGPWLMFSCWIGCLLLGAVPFGQEYSHQTMSMLAAQPISKRRLWYEKMVVLGIALVSVTIFALVLVLLSLLQIHWWRGIVTRGIVTFVADILVLVWNNWDRIVGYILASPALIWYSAALTLGPLLCTLGASPCLSLLLKNSVATVIIAPLLPLALCGSLWLMGDSLMPETMSALSVNGVALLFFVFPIVTYSTIMYLLGCRRFQKFQAIDSLAKDFSLPDWFKIPFARYSPLNWSSFAGAYASLIKKELHLHKINYLWAVVLCLACAAMVVVKWLRPATAEEVYDLPFVIYWCVLPFTIGAVTVADERTFGLLEWHLVLPPSRLKQWLLKVGTTYFVLLILGVIVPMLLGWFCRNTFGMYKLHAGMGWVDWVRGATLLIGATGIVIFSSSHSSSSIRAILWAVGMGAVVALLMPLVSGLMPDAGYLDKWFPIQVFVGICQLFSLSNAETSKLIVYILETIIGIAFGSILVLAYLNFRRSEFGRLRVWIQSSLVVVGAICIIFAYDVLYKVRLLH